MEIQVKVSLDFLDNLTAQWQEREEKHTYTIYSKATPNEKYQRISQVLHEKLSEFRITDLGEIRGRRFEDTIRRRTSLRRNNQMRYNLMHRR